jgi:HlyD family secretion protein
LREDRRLLQKLLADHTVTAPLSGTVLRLIQLSPGSVVPAGKTLLTIVPQNGEYVIRTQVQPSNINQIYPGQQVRIRFALLGSVDASDADFAGTVRSVSPDILSEPQTGKPYYRVEISFSKPEKTARNAAFAFTPGMPVEVYFTTTIQPVWAYLAKPLKAYMSRAFRET